MPCMLWFCVIWYDFAAGGASANHLLFIANTGRDCAYICVWGCVCVCLRKREPIYLGCDFACVNSVCVCVASVLKRWRVEARVRLHSEISQISYCMCSFSIHAWWFTNPKASQTNDVAYSHGFLQELKYAPPGFECFKQKKRCRLDIGKYNILIA